MSVEDMLCYDMPENEKHNQQCNINTCNVFLAILLLYYLGICIRYSYLSGNEIIRLLIGVT